MQNTELLSQYESGKRDFINYSLIGANLVRANLTGAHLSGANLSGAHLSGANLTWAHLSEANLTWAHLSEANLTGANLSGANLTGAHLSGANLSGANLTGAHLSGANLSGANLTGAHLEGTPLHFERDPLLLTKVASAALAREGLDMGSWHTCETTHCIAGWATQLHPHGKYLEGRLGTAKAGLLLLGVEAYGHFHDSNEKARKYLAAFLRD
jgi:hypothetical protein